MDSVIPRSAAGGRYTAVRWLVALPSLVIATLMGGLYLVAMPLFPVIREYYFAQQIHTYAVYQAPLLVHIAAGAVALILGPFNLLSGLRRRVSRTHRRIGAVYAVAVAISSVGAFFMAFHAYPGTLAGGRWIVTSGFCVLALVWLFSLVMAIWAITKRRDVPAHRFWILINFSLTFVAVTLRVENAILLGTGTFELLYPLLPWTSMIPNVIVAGLFARALNRRRARRRVSRSVAPEPAPLA
jgi:uncharacterized membrane protein YozB (DUF420 family)